MRFLPDWRLMMGRGLIYYLGSPRPPVEKATVKIHYFVQKKKFLREWIVLLLI